MAEGNIFTPGGIANIFAGKEELKQIYGNVEAQKLLNEQAARQRVFGSTTRPAALASFASALTANTPKAQAVSDEASNWFRTLTANNAAYKPFEDTIRPVADYGFGKVGEIAQYIPSLTRRANNQNAMNLGLAPGARSSAVDRAQYSNAGQVYSNLLGSILPWISQNATLSANERSNAQLSGLAGIEGLKNEVDRIAYRALEPANVEAASYWQDTANTQALIDAARGNIQGYELEQNLPARINSAEQASFEQMRGLVQEGMSMYSSMYGGGGGGGGMYGGGGGGGGTGGTAVPSGDLKRYMGNIPWNAGYQVPSTYPQGINFGFA